MSTGQTLVIRSTGPSDTSKAAEKLALILNGGELIELRGDVGAGKTHFVKALALALGSEDEVASPSFTIVREYKCPEDLVIHHFDFYRLDEPGIMKDELAEIVEDKNNIVVIEWSDIVRDVLPENRIVIDIGLLEDSEAREIKIRMLG